MGEGEVSLKEFYSAISDLKQEMVETRTLIKQYNGLREKFEAIDKRLCVVETSNSTIYKTIIFSATITGAIIGVLNFIFQHFTK